MQGRKAIPTQLKIIKGTHQPCRDKDVPEPSTLKPVPPSWLNQRAKMIFHHMVRRLDDLGLASRSHTEAIALLACRMEEVERFDKMLGEGFEFPIKKQNGEYEIKKFLGDIYVTTNTYGDPVFKDNPIVARREKAMKHLHSLLTEFGLSPASAQKVGTPKKKPKANDFEGF